MKKLIFKIIFVIFFSSNLASKEILKVGTIGDYFPFVYPNDTIIYDINDSRSDATQSDPITQAPKVIKLHPYSGAEPDLLIYLCDIMEVDCRFVEYEFNGENYEGIIPELKSGKFDIIMSAMNIKPERQLEIDFSIPYFTFPDGPAIGIGVRKNENDLKSRIDNAISNAINEGIIKKISIRWFEEDLTPK